MSEVLGNPVALQSILSYCIHGRDLAVIVQLNREIRATALAMLRHSSADRIGFRGRRVMTKHLLAVFQLPLWPKLKILDLRGCSHVTSGILKPLFHASSLEVLLLADCAKIQVFSLMTLLKSISKLIEQGKEGRSSFAPIKYLDVWGIGGLQLDCQYQGKSQWLYSFQCPDNRYLKMLQGSADALQIDLCVEFCRFDHPDGNIFAARRPYSVQMCQLVDTPTARKFKMFPCSACQLRYHNAHQSRCGERPDRGLASAESLLGSSQASVQWSREGCKCCGQDVPLELLGVPSDQSPSEHMRMVKELATPLMIEENAISRESSTDSLEE